MRKRIFTRLAAGLLCGALLFTDAVSLNVWAVSSDLNAEQFAALAETDEESDADVTNNEVEEKEVSPEMTSEEEAPESATADETDEEEAENPKQEAEEPTEEDKEDNEGAALPVEDEQESVLENAMEEESDSVSENTVEDELGVNSVMAASDGDIASGTYGNITWVIDAEGCLTIQGTGEYSDGWSTPWWDYRNNIKTAKVNVIGIQRISSMFSYAENLVSVDLSGLDISQVTNMEYMFSGCSSLTELDLSNFNAEQVQSAHSMFDGCKNLRKIKTPCSLQEFVKYSEDEDVEYWVRQTPVALPAEDDEIWIGPDGMGIANLPFDLSSSIEIVKNKVTEVPGENIVIGTYENITWIIDRNGKLTVNGIGEFSDRYEEDRAPWYAYRKFIKTAEINVTDITDVSYMFFACTNLTSIDLTGLDTAKVTNMSSMFENCYNLETLDLSSFDTSQVTSMANMFYMMNDGEYSLYAIPKQGVGKLKHLDLSNFDTTQVTNMHGMFFGCESLESLDISSFKTDRVESMSRMFGRCFNLTSLNLSGFNTNNTTNMDMMFFACENLENLNVSSFNTSQVTDMSYMFYCCKSLTSLDLSSFEAGKVTRMSDMLLGCSDLNRIKTPCHVTQPVILLIEGNKFWYQPDGTEITELPKGLDASIEIVKREKVVVTGENIAGGTYGNVTWVIDSNGKLTVKGTGEFADDSYLSHPAYRTLWFNYRYFIKTAEIHLTDTTNASYMFYDCENLESMDMTDFDTSKVTNMVSMFNSCNNIENLDLGGFNTSNVTNMTAMFLRCFNIKNLDLSSFDTSNVTDMTNMFRECRGLTSLDISSFDMKYFKWSVMGFFESCSNLSKINAPRGLMVAITLPSQDGEVWMMPDGTEIAELPKNLSESITLERKHKPGEDDPADSVSGKSNNISWAIDADGKLTVTGTGDWESKTVDSHRWTPWYDVRESIKTAEIDVTGVTDASYMFSDCKNLTDIVLTKFDTGNVTNMSYLFSGCENLITLNVSNFNTGKVTNMASMFSGCSKLTTLDLSSFDTGNVKDMGGMFSGCNNLTTIHTPRNVRQNAELPANSAGSKWYLSDGTVVTSLPQNLDHSVVLGITKPDEDPKDDDDIDDRDIPKDGVIPDGLWISEIAVQTYTGAAIKPEVRVYDGEKRLKQGIDYTLSYENNTIAAGDADTKPPTVVVKGKGNYSGTETKTFTIAKRDVSDTYVTKTFTDAYTPWANGKNPTLVFAAKCNNKALKKNTDYTLTVKDSDGKEVTSYGAAGTYTAVIKGTGTNYTGECSFSFEVLDKVPVGKLKIGKIAAVKYDGTSKTPEPVIKYGKLTLGKGTDYTLSYQNNTEIGTATIIISGMGDYFGTRNVTFSITGLPIKQAKFTGFINSFPYTGDKVYQSKAVLKYGENNLVEGKDYTVSYSNYLNKGKATATYTGIGAYTGSIKKTYNITAYNIAKDSQKRIKLSTDAISAVYTKGGAAPSLKVYDGTQLLTEGKDYTLSYQNNAAVTTSATVKQPTIMVKGKGNYSGTFSEKKTFTITAKDITEVTVTAPDVAASQKAGKYKSTPVLTDANGKKLKAGTDYDKTYTYTYKNKTEKVLNNGTEVTRNAGDPVDAKDIIPANTVLCVHIKAKEGGNYTGEKTADYRVTASLISKAKITVQNPAQKNTNLFPYTGQAIRLDKSNLIVKVGKEVLSEDQYEILEDTYKNNVSKGTASVQIKGVGNYGGTATVKFKIGTKGFQWVKRLFG
ncbi:MAG: BspA family leucine-rich repeat surface protein [Lachnospiraceae bacterium]|nr:BspA family leucine-rich repeat surface protein [Lachnospiraceae bacterium]